jgi:hypothetical protein
VRASGQAPHPRLRQARAIREDINSRGENAQNLLCAQVAAAAFAGLRTQLCSALGGQTQSSFRIPAARPSFEGGRHDQDSASTLT